MNARRNILLGTAGHVDHGKTALVKLLTGCQTDTLAEERARGLTIDLGFAPCRLADRRVVGIVDVPGHVDFIRNMVAGAHGIDLVLLVVAADDGVMPQTREHLNILTLMGLRHGLVALTKIDLVEDPLRAAAVEDVHRLLSGTFLERASICPVSTVTGEGFAELYDALNSAVDACPDRDCSGLFRAWVADAMTIRGFGTVITGIPSTGRVGVGDRLCLLPGDERGHVRRLEVYGEDAVEGRAGECVALNLPEIDHTRVQRGMVLTAADALAPVTMAEGELLLLPAVRGQLEDYAEVHLHVGTVTTLARVAMLERNRMLPGERQMVQLRFAEPASIVPGERFVIRAAMPGSGQAGLVTVGGGRILSTTNTRLRRRKPWTLETLAARQAAIDDPARWAAQVLRESARPVSTRDLAGRCLWSEAEAQGVVRGLQQASVVVPAPSGNWLHRDVIERVAQTILGAIQAFHTAHPQRLGMPDAELRLQADDEPMVVDLALASLLAQDRVVQHPGAWSLTGWTVRLASEEDELKEQILARVRTAGWAPPAPAELATLVQQPSGRVGRVLRLLVDRGDLVRLADGLFMHREAVEAARQIVLRLFTQAPSFTTMQFRDALAVSRKYAVPLLDHLDATRFTVRSGNVRTPGFEAKRRVIGKAPAQSHEA